MRLRNSINSAANYLLRRRGWTGLWWDFYTGAGYSDEWVSAFVASVLAKIPKRKFSRAVRLAYTRLIARHPTRLGWGYSEYTSQDADSTICVLNLAQILGEHNRRIENGYKFLLEHCQNDGGISTYGSSIYIGHYLNFDRAISFAGWCRSHTDVTANAANLIAFARREQALEYLRKKQCSDGSWRGYWWCDPEYTTALAVKALSKAEDPEDNLRIQDTIEWAMKRLEPNGMVQTHFHPKGSAFATALALQILRFGERIPTVQRYIERSVGWLLSKQDNAGFWHPSAAMRLPYPFDTNPDNYIDWITKGKGNLGEIIFDTRKIFTTAIVLETLLDLRCLRFKGCDNEL